MRGPSLNGLLLHLPGEVERRGFGEMEIQGLAVDSRKVGPGCVFGAVAGSEANGIQFVQDAISRGAVAIVAREWPHELPEGVTWLKSADPRRTLARLAAAFHGHPARKMKVVAVTGTNGKTTTATLTAGVMEAGGWPTALLGTTGIFFHGQHAPSSHTTPEGVDLHALLGDLLNRGARGVSLEASSHALHQGRLAGLDVDVAIYTHLSRDHLDYHRDMASYAAAKERLVTEVLAESIKGEGRGFAAHANDAHALALAKKWPNSLLFSAIPHPTAQVVAESATFRVEGFIAQVATPWGKVELRSPLTGPHNLENALGALTAGLLLGITLEEAAAGVEAVERVPGRLERVEESGGSGPVVLVDYAHSDDALDRVLSSLRPLTQGRLICVFGCGGDRDRGKRPLMAAAASRHAHRVVLTSDNPRTEDPLAILADAREGSPPGIDWVMEPDRARAIHRAILEAAEGDVILIAGKGHEDYQVVGTRRLPFDDRQEARVALRGWGRS